MVEVAVVLVVVPTGVLVVVVIPPESKVVLGLVYEIFGGQLAEVFMVSYRGALGMGFGGVGIVVQVMANLGSIDWAARSLGGVAFWVLLVVRRGKDNILVMLSIALDCRLAWVVVVVVFAV